MRIASGKGRKLKTTLLLVSVVSAVFACTKARARAELRAKFQTEVEAMVSEFRLPGMTAAYVLGDGTTETFAAGFSDVELGIRMTTTSRMLAASIGKTFVGALVLDLVRENRLQLDAPVKNYLGGEHWFARLPNHDSMTLRHLLTHSSGIGDHVQSPRFISACRKLLRRERAEILPTELVSFVLDTAPLFPAGTAFHYSDTGYVLTGLIIEKITGQKLFGLIAEHFIKPLALTQTGASDTAELPGLASGYQAKDNPFGLPASTTVTPGLLAWNPAIEWAGGGVISTSGDLAKWGSALYTGAALGGSYLPEILQSVAVAPEVRYGIATAIRRNRQNQRMYGHTGWIPGYCSSMLYYPELKAAIAFQINTDIGMKGRNESPLDQMESRLARLITDYRQRENPR